MKKIRYGTSLLMIELMKNCNEVLALDKFNPEDIENGDGSMFDDINKTVDDVGTSSYNLAYRIAIISGIIAIICIAISFAWRRSPMAKEENKSNLGYVVFSVGLAAGAVSIVSTIVGIVEGN